MLFFLKREESTKNRNDPHFLKFSWKTKLKRENWLSFLLPSFNTYLYFFRISCSLKNKTPKEQTKEHPIQPLTLIFKIEKEFLKILSLWGLKEEFFSAVFA